MQAPRILVRLCALLTVLVLHGAALAACQVCVVSSDKTPAFLEAFDSLSQELSRSSGARPEVALLTVSEFLEGFGGVQDARLLVTLGTDALRQVAARNTRAPVLAGLIPRLSVERVLAETGRRSSTSVAALYLDQPFGRQLDLLRLALPRLKRVGVVWGAESVSQQAQLGSALQARGLEVGDATVGEGQNLISALQMALHEADVLLAVADASVYNANTVSNILLTSYRAKVPVLAFSPAYVKAGALLSVHSSAAQAGAQLAAMAAHYLQTNTLPANQYPTDFTVTTNDYVARSLGLTLDARALGDKLHRQEKKP